MKNNNWQLYHRLLKPIMLILITLVTIIFLIWVFWFLSPTTTTPNSEFRIVGDQVNS